VEDPTVTFDAPPENKYGYCTQNDGALEMVVPIFLKKWAMFGIYMLNFCRVGCCFLNNNFGE